MLLPKASAALATKHLMTQPNSRRPSGLSPILYHQELSKDTVDGKILSVGMSNHRPTVSEVVRKPWIPQPEHFAQVSNFIAPWPSPELWPSYTQLRTLVL